MGIGDEHSSDEPHFLFGLEGVCELLRGIQSVVDFETALSGVEGGQFLGAVTDDGNALRLEILKRKPEIEDGFRAGAYDHYGSACEFLQVSGDIHRDFRSPVDSADSSGREYLYPGERSDDHCRGDGGSSVLPFGDQYRKIPPRGFGDGSAFFAEVLYFLFG